MYVKPGNPIAVHWIGYEGKQDCYVQINPHSLRFHVVKIYVFPFFSCLSFGVFSAMTILFTIDIGILFNMLM